MNDPVQCSFMFNWCVWFSALLERRDDLGRRAISRCVGFEWIFVLELACMNNMNRVGSACWLRRVGFVGMQLGTGWCALR